jgi:hypothetical protein
VPGPVRGESVHPRGTKTKHWPARHYRQGLTRHSWLRQHRAHTGRPPGRSPGSRIAAPGRGRAAAATWLPSSRRRRHPRTPAAGSGGCVGLHGCIVATISSGRYSLLVAILEMWPPSSTMCLQPACSMPGKSTKEMNYGRRWVAAVWSTARPGAQASEGCSGAGEYIGVVHCFAS